MRPLTHFHCIQILWVFVVCCVHAWAFFVEILKSQKEVIISSSQSFRQNEDAIILYLNKWDDVWNMLIFKPIGFTQQLATRNNNGPSDKIKAFKKFPWFNTWVLINWAATMQCSTEMASKHKFYVGQVIIKGFFNVESWRKKDVWEEKLCQKRWVTTLR